MEQMLLIANFKRLYLFRGQLLLIICLKGLGMSASGMRKQ